MTSFRFFFLSCLTMFFLFSTNLHAKKKWTQAQLQALLQKVQQQEINAKKKKDKELQNYYKAQKALDKRKQAGKCTKTSMPWVTKKCSLSCVLYKPTFKKKCKKVLGKKVCVPVPNGKKCVKKTNVCVPYPTTKRISLCVKPYKGKPTVFIDGKRDPVLPALRVAAKATEKAFHGLEKELSNSSKKLGKQIEKRANQVAKEAKKSFDIAIAAMKKKAKQMAKQLSNSWRAKLIAKAAALAATQGRKAYGMSKVAMKSKLVEALKNNRNYSSAKSAMSSGKTKIQIAKSQAKTAAIVLGLTAVVRATGITVTCWKYSGEKKRDCIAKNLTTAMRDTTFDIVSALTIIAADVTVIEPLSHTMAGIISAALAASTVGVGAAAYPIAYFASSVALNLAVYAVLELAVRKEFNQLFSKVAGDITSFNKSLLSQISTKDLQCWGPQNICVQ